ncbi:hypothetical protein ACJMK2_027037 [Sinanodonta woodiana]|uniref:Uncharacterized protein n=1 Tax=Sinanodonta woodiana TaxID=1069815 RepID=A0ABD3XN84_SINWO
MTFYYPNIVHVYILRVMLNYVMHLLYDVFQLQSLYVFVILYFSTLYKSMPRQKLLTVSHIRKRDPVPLSHFSQREYQSRPYVIESDIHKDYTTSVTRFQPPPYRYRYPDYFERSPAPTAYKKRELWTTPSNDYSIYSRTNEAMDPIRSRDIHDLPYMLEPESRLTKKPYVGEWVSRSTSGDLDLDEFNSDALRHGRDPLLWRNSYSNWGHDDRIDSKP